MIYYLFYDILEYLKYPTITTSSRILMLMLNQGKWRTATELINLTMALKRPLLDLSIGSIPGKHCLTGSNWRELI